MKIEVRCDADQVKLDDLEEFQEDLKSLSTEAYEELKTEIIETGLGFPIKVWKHEGRLKIIGGHQTKRTLVRMRDVEGYKVPFVPVVYTECKDEKEARRRVLQDVAQYGRVDKEGLYRFATLAEMGPGDLAKFPIPDIDIPSFNAEFFFDGQASLNNENLNPNLSAESIKTQFIVAVYCKNENEMENLFNEFQQRGLECKLIT